MRTQRIAFWVVTGLLAFVLVSGGYGELTHQWGTLETVSILGYPAYFLTIIGFWKILGGIVLVLPGLTRLKEWAYAGVVINMTGAAASHAFVGDFGPGAFHVVVTLALALLALVSWALHNAPATPSIAAATFARS